MCQKLVATPTSHACESFYLFRDQGVSVCLAMPTRHACQSFCMFRDQGVSVCWPCILDTRVNRSACSGIRVCQSAGHAY